MIVLGGIVAVLLVVQFAVSPLAKVFVNRKLAESSAYHGHVETLSISLWRGSLIVEDFVLRDREHPDDVPVVQLKHARLTVAPGAWLSGKFGGTARVDGAEITITKHETFTGPKDAADKAGAKLEEQKQKLDRWQDVLRDSVPMKLSRLEVTNSRVRFEDRTHQPAVDVGIENLHIVARDLQNRPKANGDPLPAKVEIDGVTTGHGRLHAAVQLDPISETPRFATRFELRDLSLPPFNSFLLAYANADVSKGSFEVFMQAEAKDGRYEGYVKPLFHDLDFRTASDKDKNAAQLLAKKVVSTVASVLKNDEKDQVATKTPFQGNFADNNVDIWTTVATLFRNAFVQALRAGFDAQTPRT